MGSEFGRGFGSNRGFGGDLRWHRGWGPGWGGWGWGGGCWNCGFGWGFGWGFGAGWGFGWGWGGGWWGPGWDLGWGWNPWWGPGYVYYDPWWYGVPYSYPAYDYQYNGPFDYPYNNDYQGPYNNDDDSLYGPYSSNGYTSAEPGTPLAVAAPDTNPVTANVAISAPTLLVYLKDGTMLVANDYWVEGGQFHYTVKYGSENQVALDQVDVQKSTDENAKRGVKFTLKPRPAMASVPAKPAAGTGGKPATLPPPPSINTKPVPRSLLAVA